ncbi:carboxylesterase/lipase family protein [Mycobacteroides abscessus]|uniref:carboxylesterase/lipase family protein n=1 Tax=Mycobacteroides abscessus TaxID=36809 RepID=UPI0009A7D36D|nr:carboxylesterase family protein [Mycobacteroides abscessus]SKQ85820.1 carboxylesterase [Mycobacteroides abscessus subsp. massiliense]
MSNDDQTAGARVLTTAGVLRGRRVAIGDSVIHAFLGIPFAGPLVGAARFAVPTPAASWDGERPAVAHGPTPPQSPYPPPTSELLPSVVVDGEDALNLSVWTPSPGTARLPVMVWIHGGAFVRGTHRLPVYDGAAFARDGVVVVGINYRVGALGFLSLDGAPDNRGLRDQIAALQWVRDNIAAFGGDPDQVTVFGESAGAMSIAALLSSPKAHGLFHRAIVQSGNATSASDFRDAHLVAGELCRMLNLSPTVAAVADLTAQNLQLVQDELALALQRDPDPHRWGASIIERGLAVMTMFPTIDGDVLPALPIDAIRAGAGNGVEVLAGTTRDEFRFFLVPSGFAAAVTVESLPAILARFGITHEAAELYAHNRPDKTPGDVLCALLTDRVFRSGTADLVDIYAARQDGQAWQYEFAWPTPVRDLGACHALELPFVFDTLPYAPPLTGPTPPQALADEMHTAWVQFAITGNPGWHPVGDQRPIRTFGDATLGTGAVVINPRAEELGMFVRH